MNRLTTSSALLLLLAASCKAQTNFWYDDSSTQSFGDSSSQQPLSNPTQAPITQPPSTPGSGTPAPDLTSEYCACNAKQSYLDIVFVTDVSGDMTKKSVGDATATIQSVLLGLTFGTGMFQSQVASLAFSTTVETVRDFSQFKTQSDIFNFDLPFRDGKSTAMAQSIETAASMISNNGRDFSRGVIVLMSKSYNQLDDANILEAAEEFIGDGGVLITIDYSNGVIAGLKKIASDGYYLNFGTDADALPRNTLLAFCDANCFCSEGLVPYDTANERGTPAGCYHIATSAAVFAAADNNCLKEDGFIAVSHDRSKDIFLQSLFTPGSKFWIGYKRVNGQFVWEDNSSEGACNWAAGYPRNNAGEDCVYVKPTGFNSLCYTEQCADPMNASMKYACQRRPCDSTYNCWQ